MRVEIYGEAPEKGVLRLRLRRGHEGDVQLVAVDEGGERVYGGTLLRIGSDGIHRAPGASSSLGIATEAGKVLIKD